jgi:transposase
LSDKEKQDRITELLEKILKWIKFEGKEKVRAVMDSELDDDTKKLIYHLSNGESSPKIAKTVKVDPSLVRYYWKKWAKKGIMEIHPNYKRRYRKVFSLEEVGIEVPELKQVETPREKKEIHKQGDSIE